MLRNQRNVFWQALVLTIFMFALGFILGVLMEDVRTHNIENSFMETEISLLDLRTVSYIYSLGNFDCDTAIRENLRFGDSIFFRAIKLQKYEDANKLTRAIDLEHKKYDSLRTLLWFNSIQIKQQCKASYHNVVYLYNYKETRLEKKAEQLVFSNILSELKNKEGENIMLIPIAVNNNLSSLNIMIEKYNITDYPVVIIDEKHVIDELVSAEDLEKYLG